MTFEPNSDSVASMNALGQCLNQIAQLTGECGTYLRDTGPQILQAPTADARLTIFNGLADSLTPVAEKYSVQASNYQSLAGQADQEVHAMLRTLRITPREQWDDAPRYLTGIKRLAEAALNEIDKTQDFYRSIDKLRGLSPELDEQLQRLQWAIASKAGTSFIFKRWLEEIESLGF